MRTIKHSIVDGNYHQVVNWELFERICTIREKIYGRVIETQHGDIFLGIRFSQILHKIFLCSHFGGQSLKKTSLRPRFRARLHLILRYFG